MLSVSLAEDFSVEGSGLLVVIVGVVVSISAYMSFDLVFGPCVLRALDWTAIGVWLVVGAATWVLHHHWTVSVIVRNSSLIWAVDGDHFEV
jgi:hypothetical protein